LEEGKEKDNGPTETQETEDAQIKEEPSISGGKSGREKEEAERHNQESHDKYVRLYAEFENYRKRVSKEKEELVKYGNESLLYALLPAIDHLELALKHGAYDPKTGVVQGVELTLKELQRTLGKFGLSRIEAVGKQFDPSVHHAMMQVEREDLDEKIVAEELRAGYLFHDKVLRPSLVSVSVKPKEPAGVPDAEIEKKEAEDTGAVDAENELTEIIEEE